MGAPESIGHPSDAVATRHQDQLVCPALVNAHSHLDLSDLGEISERSFIPWLSHVIRHRRSQEAPGAIEKAVLHGIERSILGGTIAVGDICGSQRAFDAVRHSGLAGVAFLEILGHGTRADELVSRIEPWVAGLSSGNENSSSGPRPGLSPHAPYSTATEIYEMARSSGLPVSTHLAESLEELEWCRSRTGLFAELIARMGAEPRSGPADGLHPLEGYVPFLPEKNGLAVHLNYVQPHHLSLLKSSQATVVYCPRASDFFGHPHGGAPGHAWREMVEMGIPVALGTDGRPCLPGDGVAGTRLSVLDDIVHLQNSCGITIEEWLPMATLNGADALGVSRECVCFSPGASPGILALGMTPGSSRQLDGNAEVEWLTDPPDIGGRV
ncbi:MAG TPA: hypothetical protein DCX60_08815 [Phycisphaerales bacterium]|nr:hypothetical protein [Phycisphaerales bacterium]